MGEVEGFTVYRFPRSTHKKIRTVNGLERVNKEIRRRTRVVGIFPNAGPEWSGSSPTKTRS